MMKTQIQLLLLACMMLASMSKPHHHRKHSEEKHGHHKSLRGVCLEQDASDVVLVNRTCRENQTCSVGPVTLPNNNTVFFCEIELTQHMLNKSCSWSSDLASGGEACKVTNDCVVGPFTGNVDGNEVTAFFCLSPQRDETSVEKSSHGRREQSHKRGQHSHGGRGSHEEGDDGDEDKEDKSREGKQRKPDGNQKSRDGGQKSRGGKRRS